MVLLGPQMHLQKEVGLAGDSVVSLDRAMFVLFWNVDGARWEEDRGIEDMLTGRGGDEGEEVEEEDEEGPHWQSVGARRGGFGGWEGLGRHDEGGHAFQRG